MTQTRPSATAITNGQALLHGVVIAGSREAGVGNGAGGATARARSTTHNE